jgi:hypothetical protein
VADGLSGVQFDADDDDRIFVRSMLRQGPTTATASSNHNSAAVTTVDRILHRLQCLWMVPPPPLSIVPMQLLWTTMPTRSFFGNHNDGNNDSNDDSPKQGGCCVSMLQLLVRIVAAATVLHSSAKESSRNILHQMVLNTTTTTTADADALAMALLEAVSPHPFDVMLSIRLTGDSVVVRRLGEAEADHDNDLMAVANGIERRGTALIDILMAVASGGNNDDDKDRRPPPPSTSSSLLPFMFRTLLLSYLSEPKHLDRLVPMVLLPLLCEKCTAHQLLDEDGSILGLLQIVIGTIVATEQQDPDHDEVVEQQRARMTATEQQRVVAASRRFSNLSGGQQPMDASAASPVVGRVGTSSAVDKEMMLGIASILLAMLTSILELSSSMQSVSEDNLDALGDVLTLVAQGHVIAASDDSRHDNTSSELAEMASQAVALIHARKSGTTSRQS